MDFFKGAAAAASGKVDEVKTSVEDSSFGSELLAMKDKLQKQAEAWKAEKMALLEQFENEKKLLLATWIQEKIEGVFDHGMNVAGEKLKEKIKDPYMPEIVKDLCDEMVDSVWPDVKTEVKDAVISGFSEKPAIGHGEDPGCCYGILAWFRYALDPYDRGFWRRIRHPLYWIFSLGRSFPRYGVIQITYFIYFLLIDKSDEYQLIEFVTLFKAFQFFTLGILSACVGSVQYYICTMSVPQNCDKHGPMESFWTVILFVFQIINVFVAFLMLNCSEKKGGFYYQYEKDAQQSIQADSNTTSGRQAALARITQSDSKGKDKIMQALRYRSEEDMKDQSKSRLMKFLIYDFVIFVLCIAIACFLAFYNLLDNSAEVTENSEGVNDGNWKFAMGLYWVKCFYGFMSFPFVVLKMPMINSLITHAKPTGYNPYGLCVPYLGKEEQRPVPWDPERQAPVEQA